MLRTPMTDEGCAPCAARGHATAPPSAPMNCRRCMPPPNEKAVGTLSNQFRLREGSQSAIRPLWAAEDVGSHMPYGGFEPQTNLQQCRERQVPVFACRAASLSISDCTAWAAWAANS